LSRVAVAGECHCPYRGSRIQSQQCTNLLPGCEVAILCGANQRTEHTQRVFSTVGRQIHTAGVAGRHHPRYVQRTIGSFNLSSRHLKCGYRGRIGKTVRRSVERSGVVSGYQNLLLQPRMQTALHHGYLHRHGVRTFSTLAARRALPYPAAAGIRSSRRRSASSMNVECLPISWKESCSSSLSI